MYKLYSLSSTTNPQQIKPMLFEPEGLSGWMWGATSVTAAAVAAAASLSASAESRLSEQLTELVCASEN